MLLLKAWLETRWRLAYLVLAALLILVTAESGGGLGSAEHARNLMLAQLGISIIAAINLAGSGIRTQSSFRAGRGLHESTYFTLSLPVSRVRLLAVRAGLGLLETAGINALMIVSAWCLFSLIRGSSTPIDLLRLLLASAVCTACFYFLSVSISTVLDETWQMYGSLFVVGVMWWGVSRLALPPSANVFAFTTDASPLITHQLPWPAMLLSLLASMLLFSITLKVVQTREY